MFTSLFVHCVHVLFVHCNVCVVHRVEVFLALSSPCSGSPVLALSSMCLGSPGSLFNVFRTTWLFVRLVQVRQALGSPCSGSPGSLFNVFKII